MNDDNAVWTALGALGAAAGSARGVAQRARGGTLLVPLEHGDEP